MAEYGFDENYLLLLREFLNLQVDFLTLGKKFGRLNSTPDTNEEQEKRKRLLKPGMTDPFGTINQVAEGLIKVRVAEVGIIKKLRARLGSKEEKFLAWIYKLHADRMSRDLERMDKQRLKDIEDIKAKRRKK